MRRSARWIGLVLACVCVASLAATTEEITGFGSNPGNLRMFEYVPAGIAGSPALVVALHGCTERAADYDDEPGWKELADRWRFVLVLPEQSALNNRRLCFNWFNGNDLLDWWWPGTDQDRGRGAALSIKQMIDKARADHDVDPHRIFVTGLSAGGAMTAVMLAAYPELFAGGAILAGVPYKCATNGWQALSQCGVDLNDEGSIPILTRTPAQWGGLVREASAHTGPWPRVSIWHGTADRKVIPADSVELVKQWTNVHAISRTPHVDRVKGQRHETYRDARGRVLVERYLIAGMGHGTPVDPGSGGEHCGKTGTFTPAMGICASYYIGRSGGSTSLPRRLSACEVSCLRAGASPHPRARVTQHDPRRGVIARALAPPMLGIDARRFQAGRERGAQQQEVHSKAGVAPECVLVHPERIDPFVGVERARGIHRNLAPEVGDTRRAFPAA